MIDTMKDKEELNDLYRVQHSLISETRKRVDKTRYSELYLFQPSLLHRT